MSDRPTINSWIQLAMNILKTHPGLRFAGFAVSGLVLCGGIVTANRWSISGLKEDVAHIDAQQKLSGQRQVLADKKLEFYQESANAQRLRLEKSHADLEKSLEDRLAALRVHQKEAFLDFKIQVMKELSDHKAQIEAIDSNQKAQLAEILRKLDELSKRPGSDK